MAMNNNFHTLHNVWCSSRKQTLREKKTKLFLRCHCFCQFFQTCITQKVFHEHKITHKAYLNLIYPMHRPVISLRVLLYKW